MPRETPMYSYVIMAWVILWLLTILIMLITNKRLCNGLLSLAIGYIMLRGYISYMDYIDCIWLTQLVSHLLPKSSR